MNLYDAYRKMFASLDDEPVVWWYCGTVMSHREGVGVVPLTQAETIMVYRTRDTAPGAFTIDWTEVGYFRDINTGEPLDGWFNPFSGATEPYPKTFVDGPATFTVTRAAAPDAVPAIALVQHNARIEAVTLDIAVNPTSLGLVQTEAKTRTFHRPDGTLPALDSPEATQIETVLSIWSDRGAVDDPAQRNVASHGFYSSGSGKAGGGTGSWAKTRVQGTMCKARPEQRINPVAWDRLQRLYPAFFKGDRIAPDWD